MTIDILTLFPDMFQSPFRESIVHRAQEKSFVTINLHNLRDWAIDKRGTVDDKPYGGGTGMLLRVEPIFNAVKEIKSKRHPEFISGSVSCHSRESGNLKTLKQVQGDTGKSTNRTILLDAGGTRYTQQKALEYSKLDQVILICGHYEGVDFRVHKYLADEIISIGDYVLTGGEIPAMIIIDSIVRLIPGVLKKEDATKIESFANLQPTTYNPRPLLEFPQYTRPDDFNGYKVPDILRSGNHAEIKKWQKKESEKRTKTIRSDLDY